ILNKALRQRKRTPLRCFDQSVRVLHKAHVTLEFIGNSQLYLAVAAATAEESNKQLQLVSSGSGSNEDDEEEKKKEDYDGEKTIDQNNLTFLISRAAVNTTVDTLIRSIASPTEKQVVRKEPKLDDKCRVI
ncbi:hypothetical protein TSAR_008019, partial [Trichomalopsis sarcophagae]